MISEKQIERYAAYIKDRYGFKESIDELKVYAKGAIERQIEAEDEFNKQHGEDAPAVRMVPKRFLTDNP